MAQHGGGSIINISSAGAMRPRPRILPYAAAKAGLNALTVGFAHAFGPIVRVNAIVAGPFLTDIAKSWPDSAARMHAKHALQRAGQPQEIVGAALFLASDASAYVTGASIAVDGGMP
jgi:NAD(P)-dependent dehydrogenase (short-subunit alcohol dehydrogenase family)